MTAEEVVSAALHQRMSGATGGLYDSAAEAVLDALKVAGYAVVELRKPNSTGRWSIRSMNDLRVEDGMVVQTLPKSSGMTESENSPHITRLVAAALLGAADAAEATDV